MVEQGDWLWCETIPEDILERVTEILEDPMAEPACETWDEPNPAEREYNGLLRRRFTLPEGALTLWFRDGTLEEPWRVEWEPVEVCQ